MKKRFLKWIMNRLGVVELPVVTLEQATEFARQCGYVDVDVVVRIRKAR